MLKGYLLSTYANEGGERSFKLHADMHKKRWVSRLMRTYVPTLFSRFWQHVCLVGSCIICRYIILPLVKQDVFVRNGLFLSNEISVFRHEISSFISNRFCQPKLAATFLTFSNRTKDLRWILVWCLNLKILRAAWSREQGIQSLFDNSRL